MSEPFAQPSAERSPDQSGDQAILVVGIGADGWDGLAPGARHALTAADVIFGGRRQLDLLPAAEAPARRRAWPSPLVPALPALLESERGQAVAVLASGDPMFFGIGTTLIRLLGPDRVRVLPHPSSVSLAAARLGWPVEDVEVISAVGRPVSPVLAAAQPGRRLFVLLPSSAAAVEVAEALTASRLGPSELTLLADLGGPTERRCSGRADGWSGPTDWPLTVLAVTVAAEPGVIGLSRSPGLPEDAYSHDGQITKREIRAVALAALAPGPGQLLWDIGAGSGSIGIEWMRTHPASRAVAVEPREDRRAAIAVNARTLGVPGLHVVAGSAPDALTGLPPGLARPDAIFVGGGVSRPGVIEAALAALRPGGRLVAHAVTLETETVLAGWYGRLGGELTRLAIQRAAPLGGFTTWRPALPVTVWSYRMPT